MEAQSFLFTNYTFHPTFRPTYFHLFDPHHLHFETLCSIKLGQAKSKSISKHHDPMRRRKGGGNSSVPVSHIWTHYTCPSSPDAFGICSHGNTHVKVGFKELFHNVFDDYEKKQYCSNTTISLFHNWEEER